MTDIPLLSIITACFNSESTIKETIESVLNQSDTKYEYIIIDGKSKDNTLDIIRSYQDKFKEKGVSYRFISEKDKGIYDAWNKGLKMANGDWISFLGSDDSYYMSALQTYRNIISLNQSKEYDLVYSKIQLAKGEENLRVIDGNWNWKSFKRFMNIPHVGAFHNKKYFQKYGLFNDTYKIAGDYEMLLRARHNLATLKNNALTVRMSHGGVSNTNISTAFKETLRAKRETGKIHFLLCYWDYFLAIIKYIIKKYLCDF